MFVIKAINVRHAYNQHVLFEQVNLDVMLGERVAIVGRNGIGKTTLLSLLTKEAELIGGTIYLKYPTEQWGYVRQHLEVQGTVEEFVRSANPAYISAKKELDIAEHALANSPTQSLKKYERAYEFFLQVGGYEWEQHVSTILTKMKLAPHMLYPSLSGGQKTKVQLAKAFASEPNVLILDEPTNHVDEETLQELEASLKSFSGTIIIVSHDRYFLDNIATAIVELSETGTKKYKGNYSFYKEQKELEARTQQSLYEKQKREKQKLQEAVQQYRQWFEKAHSAASERDPFAKKRANKNMTRFKAKEKALERLEEIQVERPKQAAQIDVSFEASTFEAKRFIEVENVTFSYDSTAFLTDVNILVERGDKIALLGKNGCGKTTILKLILGELEPKAGNMYYHPACQFGYFSQELESLDVEKTILETMLELPHMTQAEARNILACFLFRKDDVFKRIEQLSMGEKCRVAFTKLYFSCANVLVLDEPTNYLDIETRERMEEALNSYHGAIVMVSHDRYFVNEIANKIITVQDGQTQVYHGNYGDYVSKVKQVPQAEQIQLLEFQLLTRMQQEEPAEEAEKQELLTAIRNLRLEIEGLRK